jgi:beta-lactamase regulating signal transducer with metallopeptidase domain/protocatechuate 3,4-dioxygenase beta subunit/5-hydroxyisourate hydrolase-like protein (transthyretin family)
MTSFAESYAVWLADYYLLATVLLSLSLSVIAFLKQPAQRLMVTKSSLAALVLLAILCAIPGWSLVHLLAAERPAHVVEPLQEQPMSVAYVSARPELFQTNTLRPAAPPSLSLPVAEEARPQPIAQKINWPASLAIAHLLGMAGIIVWLALGCVASVRLRRTAKLAPASIRAILDQLATLYVLSSKRPQLSTHDCIDVAVALGIWKPIILLPTRWAATQSADRLRVVLAHEATHVHNCDLQWVAVARALFVPLWANPLFWLAKRRLRLDQEALADAAAARITSRQQYAEQLVAWARDARSRPALHLSSAVGLWEGPSQLRQRVAILLDEKLTVLRNCSRRWRIVAALTLLTTATGLSLITIRPGNSQAAATTSENKAPDVPGAPQTGTLTLRFEYDGTPPAPRELKEWSWRNKLDDRELGRINIEKEVGAKVFDESLVIGKDRGIANIFVWVRSKDIPNLSTVDSVPNHRDEKKGMNVPDHYIGPPVTLSYHKGRYEPHALAFEWPRQLRLRNDDPKTTCGFVDQGTASANPLLRPGEERLVDVRPESLPHKVWGNLVPSKEEKGYSRLNWPEAWVLPLGHPYFAVSDKTGTAQIKNLPPGKWEFQVWHQRPGYVKNWRMGRFTLDVKPGDNDLGTVKLAPSVFNESEVNSSEPQHTTSTTVTQPQEKKPAAKSVVDPLRPESLVNVYRKHFKEQPEPNVMGGIVVDEMFQPVAQAQVSLYRFNLRDNTQKLIAEKSTDANGTVRFDHVIDVAKEFSGGKIPPDNGTAEELLQVIVRAPGRATQSQMQTQPRVAKFGSPIIVIMPPAAALSGRVTGSDGKPVAGASVSLGTGFTPGEASSARTGADGNYVINDAPPVDFKRQHEYEAAMRSGDLAALKFRASPPVLTLRVEHPDFAVAQVQVEKTPGTKDVQMQPGAILTGRVVFGGSGDTAGGARVFVAGHSQRLSEKKGDDAGNHDEQRRYAIPIFTAFARADEGGKYRFASLPAGYYHLSAELPGWVNVGLRDIPAAPGKTNAAPDLTLTKGGTVTIRLVDAKTREPIKVPPEAQALIGSSERPLFDRPPIERRISVNKNGLFELPLPAGKHEIYVGAVYVGEDWKWMGGTAPFTENSNAVVTVAESKTVQAELAVINAKSAKVTGTFSTVVPGPLPNAKLKAIPPAKKNQNENSSDKSKQMSTPRPQPNVVSGQIFDDLRQPIAGAEAILFRINRIDSSRKLQAKTTTDANGQYRFENVIDIPKEFPDGKLSPLNPLEEEFVQVYARAPGRVAGSGMEVRQQIARAGDIFDMTLQLAYKLGGQVTGPDGKPIAGALVSVGDFGWAQWDEVASAHTNSDGRYMINDAAPYSMEEYEKKKVELRTKKNQSDGHSFQYSIMAAPPIVTVKHPDFALKRTTYDKIPGTQDIKLEPAAIIQGRVVMENSGKPAAAAVVHLSTSQSRNDVTFLTQSLLLREADARTDADGKYRFAMLSAGNYDLSAEMPDWVNKRIDEFAAKPGTSTTAPTLTLTKGGVISIRIIDDATGKPIPLKDSRAEVLAHPFPLPKGISRPSWLPDAKANSAGRFELRALPGKRAVMVSHVEEAGELTWIAEQSQQTKPTIVEVVEGKTVEVDISVIAMSNKPATDATYGTLQLAPAEKVQPPPKAKSSSNRATNKKDGARTSPPKAQDTTAQPKRPPIKRSTGDKEEITTAPITISGRTIDRQLQPIAGATVYLASLQPGFKRLAQTVSDSEGKYKFDRLQLPVRKSTTNSRSADGEFELFGVAEGYGLSWREPKSFYPTDEHVTNEYIDTKDGERRMYGTDDVIDLDLRFLEPAKVRGRVVDHQGKSIPGTLLDIRNADSQWDKSDYNILSDKDYFEAINERNIVPRNLKTRTVDENGNFEFTHLPVDHRFWIWVHAPGYPVHQVWAVTNSTVDVTKKGPDVFNDDFVLQLAKPFKVPIQVLFADTGKPAPKVHVGTGGSSGSTDADGRVELKLAEGEYSLELLPRIGTPYWLTEVPLVVSDASVREPARVELRPAVVVSVNVVDAESGKPLPGVDLWRQNPDANQPPSSSNEYYFRSWEVETRIAHVERHRTDKDGKMQILFEPGKHRVGVGLQAFPIGYEPAEPKGKTIELEAGKPQSIQFEMRKKAQLGAAADTKKTPPTETSAPAPTAEGAASEPTKTVVRKPDATELSGRVEGPDGKPLPGVTVDAFTWYPGNETKTDDKGQFVLKKLDPREPVEIEFRKAGFGPRHFNTQHTGKTNWVVQMDDSTYMEGQVVDPQGEPVPTALIRAERKALNEQGNQVGEVFTDTRTDKNGNFRLYLESDKYGIKVRVPGRGVARYEQQSIAKGEKKLFNFNLERGQTFRAMVLDAISHKPVEGIILFNWRHKGTEGKSNADGVLEVSDMFPGKFEFNVSAVGDDRMRSSVAGKYARWWSEQATEDRERKPTPIRYGLNGNWDSLTFDIGTDSQAATIYIEPCVTITGRVVDPDGKPVAGAMVAPAATGTGNSITGDTRYSYETKKDGKFEMKLPASGTGQYNLIAHDGKYGKWRKWANYTGEPFRTEPGSRIDNGDLQLIRPATIRGRVGTAVLTAAPNKEVRAADVDGRNNRYYVPTTRVDGNGNFELKFVAPGKHFIQIDPFYLDPKIAPLGTSTVVDVKEGETIDDIQIGTAK